MKHHKNQAGKHLFGTLPINNGVKQGDALSPVLFIYAVEQRFSNCGPRTASGPRVLPLWSF